MCRRPRVVLFSLLVATMNASAQDSAPPPRSSSPKEKAQALAALTEARGAVFSLRRKGEARPAAPSDSVVARSNRSSGPI